MNAKKIMGAVLVALLAAALFTGAAAAAEKDDLGVVFIYEKLPAGFDAGTWTSGANTVTLIDDGTNAYFSAGANFVEGVYENATKKITVLYPTATITAVAGSTPQYMVADGGIYYGDGITIKAYSASIAKTKGDVTSFKVTYPNGEVKTTTGVTFSDLGKYTIQPVFPEDDFVPGTPANYLYSKAVYTITLADEDDVTLTAAGETVIESGVTTVTVNAKPGQTIDLQATKFTFVSVNGVTKDIEGKDIIYFEMPNTGVATVYIKAGTTLGTGKILETNEDESVSFQIVAGTITAKTDKDSYFVGNKVVLTGTSTAGNTLHLYIEGTNVGLRQLGIQVDVLSDGTWEKELTYSDLKGKLNKLDAGTYSIYVSNKDIADLIKKGKVQPNNWDASDLKTYTTASVVLKQPFISVTDAPAVAVKGTDYKVTGTAEATEDIYVYIFGTNFFTAMSNNDTAPYNHQYYGIPKDKTSISLDKNEFEIEFEVPKNISAGQYFMVVQHPMYDGYFNIWSNSTEIMTAATENGALKNPATLLFDVADRQSANAAQALCDALDTQNIDDMYVKLSFVVANAVSTINPLPAEVTKGSKLTVSGTTNMGDDKVVTVEILSTAFAAVPKETVGSASFIALTTKTDENGNWEVTFDTSGLNIDEYVVSATVENFDPTTAKINVIEGAPTQPTETPVTPTETQTQPTQTETPKSPGFGALAALAGLGAVAVLLLRRE